MAAVTRADVQRWLARHPIDRFRAFPDWRDARALTRWLWGDGLPAGQSRRLQRLLLRAAQATHPFGQRVAQHLEDLDPPREPPRPVSRAVARQPIARIRAREMLAWWERRSHLDPELNCADARDLFRWTGLYTAGYAPEQRRAVLLTALRAVAHNEGAFARRRDAYHRAMGEPWKVHPRRRRLPRKET